MKNKKTKKKYKIVVAAKERSIRLPNKNEILLRYTLDWLQKAGQIKHTVVVTDSEKFFLIAKEYGCEALEENYDGFRTDIAAFSMVAKKYKTDYIFGVPITTPFRNIALFDSMLEAIDKYDFVTTYRDVVDRSIFMLDDDSSFLLKRKNIERKGVNCPRRKMVSGTLYCIKTKVLKHREIFSENVYKYFWNLKMGVVLDNHPHYVDIDYLDDMSNFIRILGKEIL